MDNETTVTDERLAEILARVSPPADGWQAGLPTMDIHSIITELTTLRAAQPQATNCAMCGEHKPTPLRRDEMGGYVCLTCVETRLDSAKAQPSEAVAGVRSVASVMLDEWQDGKDGDDVFGLHANALKAALAAALSPQPKEMDE